MDLKEFFEKHTKVAIAFSGGCDSAYLSYEALKYCKSVKAYYVKTCFQPEFELKDALRFAKEYNLDLSIIEYDILKEKEICGNPDIRCYYCKKKIFSLIKEKAHADGFEVILDGNNASDDASDRPGMKVLEEMEVLSPLRLCKLTKPEIRNLSKEAGLFTWDKPAYACLATRVPVNTLITKEILDITEKSESFMSLNGFSDFRVRYRDGKALIQLPKEQHELYARKKELIEKELLTYYREVILDSKPRIKSN